MIKVRASQVRFYSPLDEDAFFEWLKKIKSIKDVFGEVRDIVLCFDNAPIQDADFHEVIAVFRRYKVDKTELRKLVNENNDDWVRSWEPDIFSQTS